MPVPYEQLSSPARTAFVVAAAAFAAGELVQAFRLRRGAASADLPAEIAFRLLFFAAILMLPIGRAVSPGAVIGGGGPVFTLGLTVGLLGLLLRWWSFATLGSYFTVVVKTSEDQTVVDRGPYRVLRHPSYTGLLLALAGAGVMWGNWLSAAGAVTLTLVALLYRLRIEERALTAALGDRYREFAATRARLIPYIW
ncbi:methyltransferase family protein [Paractinoplanes toevensis]|uniref:methyltransferase family protein n=1 Tax=Paractinoplanes toevensis TaxID=571911 RepID=UPI001BB3BBFE|nr:isoprenylcysteine carboxylmethyltransferase family protein [Actinoplanes toevensis]